MGNTDNGTGGWDAGGAGGGPALLAIAQAERRGDVEAVASAIAGVRLALIDWAEAADRLTHPGATSIILADARGVPDAGLAAGLALLEDIARAGETRVIVVLDFDQIDAITAALDAPGVDLLCAPTLGEIAAALWLAGRDRGGVVRDTSRDAEAERLRHLHAEVARIAETLTRLTRGEPPAPPRDPAAVGEPSLAYRAGPARDVPAISAREIRDAIRARRLRDQHFGPGLFEDPAWDMLLDLFAAELERTQVSVSSLCIAAAVAPTTALRWIAKMTEAGLFVRHPDPFDRRRAFLALSPGTSAAMQAYIAAVRRMGAGIV